MIEREADAEYKRRMGRPNWEPREPSPLSGNSKNSKQSEMSEATPTVGTASVRVVFWVCWVGTLANFLGDYYQYLMESHSYGYETTPFGELMVIGFIAEVGLCFSSAGMVKPFPHLACLGIITVGLVFIVPLFLHFGH